MSAPAARETRPKPSPADGPSTCSHRGRVPRSTQTALATDLRRNSRVHRRDVLGQAPNPGSHRPRRTAKTEGEGFEPSSDQSGLKRLSRLPLYRESWLCRAIHWPLDGPWGRKWGSLGGYSTDHDGSDLAGPLTLTQAATTSHSANAELSTISRDIRLRPRGNLPDPSRPRPGMSSRGNPGCSTASASLGGSRPEAREGCRGRYS